MVGHDLESCHLNFIVRHRGGSQLPILNRNAGVRSKLKVKRTQYEKDLHPLFQVTLSHSSYFGEFVETRFG